MNESSLKHFYDALMAARAIQQIPAFIRELEAIPGLI